MNSIIKLTNGETIIAEVAHQDDEVTCVLEPLALEIAESQETGNPMMVALTWVPLTKKVNMVNINTSHVVAVSDTDEDLDKYYKKSLAILKGDVETLREMLLDEATDEDVKNIKSNIETDELQKKADEPDPWMDTFGKPVEIQTSANTVH